MEKNVNSNNTPDYSMDNSGNTPAYAEEKKREAICKKCGVIWHPRKTDTRRPTRCPYCQSHRTEWLDIHPELLADRGKESNADETPRVETQVENLETDGEKWNNPDYSMEESMEESMEDTGISQGYTEDETDDDSSDKGSNGDYSTAYARSAPGINPDYTGSYATQKKNTVRIPIGVVLALLGAGLIYGAYCIWKIWKKPAQKKDTDSRPADTAFTTENVTTPIMIETPHMGLADMAMKQHYLL